MRLSQNGISQITLGSSHAGHSQRGSTLVAVLLILLIITVLGAMAMKQGLATLSVSTASQVRQLLVQSADSALNQIVRNPFSVINSQSNVVGYAMLNPTDSSGNQIEYVFCYRPQSSQAFGATINSSAIKANSTLDKPDLVNGNALGFCSLTTDLGRAKGAAVTQVSVTSPQDTTGIAATFQQGSNPDVGSTGAGLLNTKRVRVTSTSMLPALSATDPSVVQSTCLGSGITPSRLADNTLQLQQQTSTTSGGITTYTNVAPESLTDCLARMGMPADTQVQEYYQQILLQ